jgi:glycosyltransferase involved in cell wall biosynthesis
VVHTFLGVLYAAIRRPDILHVHAVGPGLFVPLARLLGLRVLMTHHGPDYERQKWGPIARLALRTGEAWGVRGSHRCIAISRGIAAMVRERYGIAAEIVPNGVQPPPARVGTAYIEKLGLEPGRYVLNVARFVPEKRHLDLIEAFRKADMKGWRLVLAGAADHPDAYCEKVRSAAAADPRIVLPGFTVGDDLAQLYAHAGCFVLPSSHEGFPIAALEALSYGLLVIASDIPANRELDLSDDHYFRPGDAGMLRERLERVAGSIRPPEEADAVRRWAIGRWSWWEIARSTFNIIGSILQQQSGSPRPAAGIGEEPRRSPSRR